MVQLNHHETLGGHKQVRISALSMLNVLLGRQLKYPAMIMSLWVQWRPEMPVLLAGSFEDLWAGGSWARGS